jgi:hypothetical protein
MAFLKSRFAEPSTWAGFAAVVTAAAVVPSPYAWIVIGCGCVATFLGEKATS